jgi:predicted RNA-binding protein with EMAP domain
MFRPDPNGPHSAREAVAKLSEVLKEEPSDSPRAKKLASMIRELQNGEVKK